MICKTILSFFFLFQKSIDDRVYNFFVLKKFYIFTVDCSEKITV